MISCPWVARSFPVRSSGPAALLDRDCPLLAEPSFFVPKKEIFHLGIQLSVITSYYFCDCAVRVTPSAHMRAMSHKVRGKVKACQTARSGLHLLYLSAWRSGYSLGAMAETQACGGEAEIEGEKVTWRFGPRSAELFALLPLTDSQDHACLAEIRVRELTGAIGREGIDLCRAVQGKWARPLKQARAGRSRSRRRLQSTPHTGLHPTPSVHCSIWSTLRENGTIKWLVCPIWESLGPGNPKEHRLLSRSILVVRPRSRFAFALPRIPFLSI